MNTNEDTLQVAVIGQQFLWAAWLKEQKGRSLGKPVGTEQELEFNL